MKIFDNVLTAVTLAFSLFVLISLSGCSSRGSIFYDASKDEARQQALAARAELKAFLKNVDTNTTREQIEDALGEPTSHNLIDGQMIYYYDFKEPIYVTYTTEGKVKTFAANTDLIKRREAREAAYINNPHGYVPSSFQPTRHCTYQQGAPGTMISSCQ